MKKIKSILIMMLAVNFIFGLTLVYDHIKTSSLEAQTCTTLPTNIAFINCGWTGNIKESWSNFTCGGSSEVLRGRYHTGDENGSTRYLCCTMSAA